MTNNTNGIFTDITIDNKKLETIRSCKYPGAIASDEGSKPEVLFRIAQAISSKIRLMCSLAMFIFLHACETLAITADMGRRMHALEMRCFHKLFGS